MTKNMRPVYRHGDMIEIMARPLARTEPYSIEEERAIERKLGLRGGSIVGEEIEQEPDDYEQGCESGAQEARDSVHFAVTQLHTKPYTALNRIIAELEVKPPRKVLQSIRAGVQREKGTRR